MANGANKAAMPTIMPKGAKIKNSKATRGINPNQVTAIYPKLLTSIFPLWHLGQFIDHTSPEELS
jgi:hypothetical protein